MKGRRPRRRRPGGMLHRRLPARKRAGAGPSRWDVQRKQPQGDEEREQVARRREGQHAPVTAKRGEQNLRRSGPPY